MSKPLFRKPLLLGKFRADASQLGLGEACKLLLAQGLTILMRDFGFRHRQWCGELRVPALAHPLIFRYFSSDVYTIRQTLVTREHEPVSRLGPLRLIVDCGANIGASAACLLSYYPSATLIAIEPDADNFAVLEKNLAPYGARARAVRAAVWPREGEALRCVRGSFADGLDWSATVSAAADREGDIEGITLSRVLDDSGLQAIDLLKMDIEGAERLVFGAGCERWLARTHHLCIELHGAECDAAFERAMSSFAFEREQSNELTICTNLRRAAPPKDADLPRRQR
jgi:FkbM family methyltransferase